MGGYLLLMPVGAGGMGRVWAARRQESPNSNIVAVKTAIEEMIGDREFERVLLDEARIASRIVHPNVCAIHELGKDRGIPFLVMEWMDAGTLLDVLTASPQRRIDVFVAIRIISEVAAGLHAAHELTEPDGQQMNVVHRDVSPQNILLSSKGHIKVADFGVARARGQLHKPTETGELKGKLSYMAPEQLTSKLFDRRADVFALGCCLYEATTGQRPFHGGDALETMYKLLETDCVRPSDLVPDYPPALEEVVLKALEKEVSKRYQTAEELRCALGGVLAQHGRLVTEMDVAAVVRSALQPVIDARTKALADAIRDVESRNTPHTADSPADPTLNTGNTPQFWSTSPPKANYAKRWLWSIGPAVLLVAAAVLGTGYLRNARSVNRMPAQTATPKPAPAAIQLVSISVNTDPSGAELRIDDGPAAPGPLTLQLVPDHKVHQITAQLAGYDVLRKEVMFDHDQNIILGLKPERQEPVTLVRPPSSKAASTGAKRSTDTSTETSTRRSLKGKRSIDSSNPFADP